MAKWNTFCYALVGMHCFFFTMAWLEGFICFVFFFFVFFFLFSGKSFENLLFLVW